MDLNQYMIGLHQKCEDDFIFPFFDKQRDPSMVLSLSIISTSYLYVNNVRAHLSKDA
jgi:hypothetical protein